ncbi:hybrid sensor histidine kinase/response regulator [Pseudodesulfovibrio indicus]|uniref:Sensory/regulatory protein RpfC n=1 Tax=Pseudodesulfovibrio indicus TaxID=1716143 RepID=A0AA94TR88_9BACT|nr:response regulator [Pseudodesulfovibrio indicus]TDT92094.1 signal transduction histidine kinase [Pseudodesulfovibrio indicus]
MRRLKLTSIWVRSFIGTILFLGGISAFGLYMLYSQARSSIEKTIRMNEQVHNRMVTQEIDLDLKNLFMDLSLVANHVETKRFLLDPTPENRADLESEFLALCTISEAYDQVRLLSNEGMELTRVNYNGGSPAAVPPDNLQDKSDRYYFTDSLPLKNGEVYVSKFDLNIENKQIELPLKPMIRVSTPVYDDGKRLGIAILNYLGQRIIDKCMDSRDLQGSTTLLLNKDGYWLASPVPDQNWAFMYRGRENIRFSARHPEAWERIQQTDFGQFTTREGVYTVSTVSVSPQTGIRTNARQTHSWKVVCFTPNSVVAATIRPARNNYLVIFGLLMLIIIFGGLTRARFMAAGEKNRQALESARKEAEEANRAKSDFLARMSHEIRTPMNAIIGLTHLALKTGLTAKQADYLSKVSLSANSLLGIINDILDFSKIEAGKLTVEESDFLLDDVLNNVINILGLTAEQKGIEFLLMVKSSVPNRLRGDPLRLGQVLLNLTNNAIKFTKEGEVMIMADLIRENDTDAVIRFSVRDTGIGIDREHMARLFQPFSQADGSITRQFGGTGLGLVICKRLVELMGGEITVTSDPGFGSEFTFALPFKLQPEHAKDTFEYPSEIRGMAVLVVDDSKMSRKVMCKVLESFTFRVEMATRAREALDILVRRDGSDPIMLVVTDWNMPDMDGIQLTKAIRKNRDITQKPKVIMLTAYGQDAIRHQAREAGLDGFMLKPFNRSILFDTIMDALSGNSERRTGTVVQAAQGGVPDNLRGAHVLLAEDNEINQQVAQEILEGANISVTIATNGREAVELALSEDFDAVLMDIQMPIMDGFKAVKAIREAGKTDLPIIAMTAHALVGDREKSLGSGMNDHVTKPIDPEVLMETLSKWLPGSRDHGEAQKAEPATGPAPAPKNGGFPTIPGLDVDNSLVRLRGNEALYRKLLLDFAKDSGPMLDKLAAGAEDDVEESRALAHNIKGVAGNIGAARLHALFSELENRLGHVDSRPLLKRAVEELREVSKNIQAAFPSEEREEDDLGELDVEGVMALLPKLERLLALLRKHDVDARTVFRDVEKDLRHSAPVQTTHICDQIDHFNFGEAGKELTNLIELCREDEDSRA